MNLLAVRHLDPVQSVELGQECIGIINDVVVVVPEDLSQELVLGVMDSLDDVLVVSGEVEEATTLSRRPKLGEDVLPSEGHQVVGGVQPEQGA